jgi:hypothetical protein
MKWFEPDFEIRAPDFETGSRQHKNSRSKMPSHV